MLDLRLIREQPEAVGRALADKGGAELIDQILGRDVERRRILKEGEELKALRNRASEAIGQARRRGEDASNEQARMREVGDRIKTLDADLKAVDEAIETLLVQVPNVPHPSVPPGKSDDDNVEVRRWGTPRQFDFTPRPHEEVGEALGLLDMERAGRIAKARFAIMWGALARLERALATFMLDLQTREHGYTELWLPHMVNGETMLKTGQLPKFEDSLFKTVEADEGRTLYLIPTAEVPLSALHAGEILPERTLPRRYTAFSACYRREAGTYGKDTAGLYRVHQFDKCEQVVICRNDVEESKRWHEEMRRYSEELLQRLNLPYRVIQCCTGDIGVKNAAMMDVETWMPSRQSGDDPDSGYGETHSASRLYEFQARRLNLRYKSADGKLKFVHTQNNTVVASPRILIPILENYQNADGTVTVPEALRKYMNGVERIEPPRK